MRVRIAVPGELARYVAEKGSVAIDGVSLTVTGVGSPVGTESWCEVVLIPHTIDVTVLGTRVSGDRVNVEVDVIAKYIERMLEAQR